MPDRISTYRQIRLAINLTPQQLRAAWVASTIDVRKGVPTAHPLDNGAFPLGALPQRPEDCVRLLDEAVQVLCARWYLE